MTTILKLRNCLSFEQKSCDHKKIYKIFKNIKLLKNFEISQQRREQILN